MHAGRIVPTAPARPRSGVRFETDRAQAIAERHGLRTIADIAEFYGTTETTYSRVTRGLNRPGEEFIGSVLTSPAAKAYPDEVTWDALFTPIGPEQ